MRSLLNRISLLLLPLALSVVSACTASGAIPPPAADLQAAVEPKPVPTDEIATSQKASDDYSASVEAWGDRISSAGGRICRWSNSVFKLKLNCPPKP